MSLSKQELAKIKRFLLTEGLASNDVASILNYEDDFILQKKWELADAILDQCPVKDYETHMEVWELLGLPATWGQVDGPTAKISDHPLEEYINQAELMDTTSLVREIKTLREEIAKMAVTVGELAKAVKELTR